MKTAIAAVLALPLLSACNTVAGVGKDVQAVGSGISSASTYVQREVFGAGPRRTDVASVNYIAATPQPRQPTVSVGRACDPNGELAGGEGLPPCQTRAIRSYSRR